MYALDANSITGHKAAVRFLSEHLAALIKPDLINSDKGRKIEGAKKRENWRKFTTPDTDLSKKKKKGMCGGGRGWSKLHSSL